MPVYSDEDVKKAEKAILKAYEKAKRAVSGLDFETWDKLLLKIFDDADERQEAAINKIFDDLMSLDASVPSVLVILKRWKEKEIVYDNFTTMISMLIVAYQALLLAGHYSNFCETIDDQNLLQNLINEVRNKEED